MACLCIYCFILELCNLHVLHKMITPRPTNKILLLIQKHMGKFFVLVFNLQQHGFRKPQLPFYQHHKKPWCELFFHIWLSLFWIQGTLAGIYLEKKVPQLKCSIEVLFLHQLFSNFLVLFFFMLGDKMKGFRFPAMGKIIIFSAFKGFYFEDKISFNSNGNCSKISDTVISDCIKTLKK